jgi:Ca-activated chloride channel family protein
MKRSVLLFFLGAAALALGCSSQREEQSPEPAPPGDGNVETSPASTPTQPVEAAAVTAGKIREELTSLQDSAAAAGRAESAQPVTAPRSAQQRQMQSADLAFLRPPAEPLDRERYTHYDDNPVHLARDEPVSTFSIDVDTASYSNVRRQLAQGLLPRRDAVRVEELINYFSYRYPVPDTAETPFSLYTELGPSPWHAERRLLHIGIKGFELPREQLPPANLVFLVDVSGSMQSPDKIGLLKSSLKLLAKQLDADDRIAIAVYAGAAGTVLEPTSGAQRAKILSAVERLTAGGSTNGAAGIRLAYALAEQGFRAGGINRVILATDGDFNVGTTSLEALEDLIEEKRKSGVALTVLGFGTGNYNDALMQELAQRGNGNAAYIDTLNEARKVLVDELGQTLNTIAKDVKLQIEFNPARVAEYRLIGYETRHLEREDFNNDAVDAGDIGAGHTVTAIYEIALTGAGGNLVDPLRYGGAPEDAAIGAGELAFLKLRYKAPDSDASRLISRAIRDDEMIDELADTSDNYRFSAAVAAFGQLLRGGEYLNGFGYADATALARSARSDDPAGYRGEFLTLLRTAEVLATPTRADLEVSQGH